MTHTGRLLAKPTFETRAMLIAERTFGEDTQRFETGGETTGRCRARDGSGVCGERYGTGKISAGCDKPGDYSKRSL